jgi:hypothetical protein
MRVALWLILAFAGSALGQQTGGNGVPGPTSGSGGGAPSGSAGGALSGSYPNPGLASTAVVSAVAGQSISPKSSNQILQAFGFPSSCTTTSGTYNTQGDCAYFSALDVVYATGNPVDLVIGNGYLLSCAEWMEPNSGFVAVNIVGTSLNSSYIIRSCNTYPNTPMLGRFTDGSDSYLKISDVTFIANNNANSCFDLPYLYDFEFRNISCSGVISGSDHLLQIGGNNAAFAEDGIIDNVGVGPPYAGTGAFATITPTFTGTSLTSLSCGSNCGSYPNPSYVVGIVNDPHKYCTVLPAFTPVMSGTAIDSFTITTAGTCSSPPDFVAMMQDNIQYGMKLYVSDATVTSINPNDGKIGAIFYGNVNLLHAHPVDVQTGFVFSSPGGNGNTQIYGTECDTIGSLCMDFQTTSPITLTGHQQVWGSTSLPGSSLFNLESSAASVQFSQLGNICGYQGCPTDIQEFIGPSGVLVPGGPGWPALSSVLENDPVYGNGDYDGNSLSGSPPSPGYTSVYTWGDSLTQGNQDGSGTTYATVLHTLSGLPVTNEGIFGQTSLQIAVRMGAIPTTVTVTGGSIPASGGVTVTFAAGYEPCYDATTAPGLLGVIDGISGYCTDNGSHVYTFTRVTSGSAVSYSSGAWTPSVVPPANSLNIIWAGRNDTFTSANATLANIKAMVNSLPSSSTFLVLPIINLLGNSELNTGFSMGSNYAFIDGINQTLAAVYPNNFIDIRRNLVNAYNPSLRADQLDFSRDGTPESYRAVYSGGTLSTTMTSSTCTFTIAGVAVSTLQNPDQIITFSDNGEQVLVTSSSSSLQSTACIRGYAGTTAAAHSSSTGLTVTDYLHLGANGYTLVANNAYTWMLAHPSASTSSRLTPYSTVFQVGSNAAGAQRSTAPSVAFGRTELLQSYNHNVGLGANAGQNIYFANAPGVDSTFLGDNSFSAATTAAQVTAVGFGACNLLTTTESRDVCFGYQSEVAAGISNSAEIGTGTNSTAHTMQFNTFNFLTDSGVFTGAAYLTSANCSSSASPAVCASAAAGSVAVPAAGTTLVVNTTAVTANSQIMLTFDSSLGTKLGVTCNTTANQPTVSARTAGTSFTITMSGSITTNPDCLSYSILN